MNNLLPRHLSSRSIRLFIEQRFGGDSARFLASLSDAMNQAVRTDLKGAGILAKRVEELIPFFRGVDRALVLRIGARHRHLSGDAKGALERYRRAHRSYLRAGEDIAAARVARAMVDVLMYLGRYDQAERIGRDAARVFRRRKMEFEWAQTICNLGNVYHRKDDNLRALQAYDNAHAVIRTTNQTPALALIQLNRGNILSNLNRLDEATACYEEAQRLYAESGMKLAAAQAEYSLAYLTFLRGQLADALTKFEKVRTAFEALGDQRGRAQTRLDILEIQLQLNLHTVIEAEAPVIALLFRQLGMRYEQAKCCYFLAKARAYLEDAPGALMAIREARRLLNGEGNTVWKGSTDLLEARLLAFGGKPEAARAGALSALSSFRRAGDVRRSAAASLFLADLDIKGNRLLQSHRRLAPFLENDSAYPASVAFEAWWMHGRAQRAAGDNDAAIKSYELAMGRAERLVEGVPPDETRIFYLSDKLAVYHELMGLLLEKRRYPAALRVLEDSRHIRRAAYHSAAEKTPTGLLPQALTRRQDELRSRLHRLYGFPTSMDRFAPVSFEVLRRSEDQLWRLVQRGRRLSGTPGPQTGKAASSALNLQTPTGRAVLVFATDGENPYVFILTGSRILCRRLPAGWQRLSDLLTRFYFFIEKNRMPGGFRVSHESEIIASANSQLAELSEAILWPVLADLAGHRDLTFVPFGMLNAVPFHALPLPDGNPLLATHIVRHAVDLTSAVSRSPAALPQVPQGEVFSPGRPETKEMDEEAAEIHRLFPGSSHFTKDQANGIQLRRSLAKATAFLHIASHASAALDNPIFSEILLNDGPFYAFDLFGHPVRQVLVTLAACQTGRPGVLPSGEIYGLAEAFLGQGAKCVLSSLWTVDDHTARVFMTCFYRRLKEGDGLNLAWTTAVRELRQSYENPYHWAPFVLIGLTN
jgi:tetratricopeptide (TPR) repeat protein